MATSAAEQIFVRLRRLIAAVILHNDRVAQQTGMSMSESQFVHLLDLHGPMTPSELSARSGLTSGSVTGVLDRLEALEFVRRERHPDDRRKVLVVLDGERVARQLAPLFAEQGARTQRAIDALSASEQRAVAKFLGLLTDDPE
ncbi:MAG: MarR family winged helix-turn-helix transcriptional regulator [Jatrophihabitans sp.]|uniref:MarR family winged helix-turn-helix transcriptional regulator n=1 Tax=Jatrophihabitans sp. TaxID=1932789 RepID=UPI003F7E856D